MRNEPVPGWHTSAVALGLPAGVAFNLIGSIGDRGIFLAIDDAGWWVVGIDVSDGHRLFAPVRLGDSENSTAFSCFMNGPTMALCLRKDADRPLQPGCG